MTPLLCLGDALAADGVPPPPSPSSSGVEARAARLYAPDNNLTRNTARTL
jgi:hypothetical protein